MALNKILSFFQFNDDDFDDEDDDIEDTAAKRQARREAEDEAMERFSRNNGTSYERPDRNGRADRTGRSNDRNERSERAERSIDRPAQARPAQVKSTSMRNNDFDSDSDYRAGRGTGSRTERTGAAPSKVVPIKSPRNGFEVTVTRPSSFDDSQDICDLLIQGKAVIANLEGFDAIEAQRIMDFISGCVYAMNGNLHQISRSIFVFSAENIDLSGDFLDTMTSQGFGIPAMNNSF